jgi:hypothetical protein
MTIAHHSGRRTTRQKENETYIEKQSVWSFGAFLVKLRKGLFKRSQHRFRRRQCFDYNDNGKIFTMFFKWECLMLLARSTRYLNDTIILFYRLCIE